MSDADSGTVTWRLQSFDEVTGLAPLDPTAGFLPLNDATHQGEGFVTFSIEPVTGLANGEQITNTASIVFDVNQPIITNETLNTIDTASPTSSIDALPTEVRSVSFDVSWSGSDDGGSGAAFYDVYVSDNGGPETLWLAGTPDTTSTFVGEPMHTYSFYSIARDNAGHIEQIPQEFDASTTVVATVTTADIDGNNRFEPLSDGILAIRYLAGFTGNALTVGVVDPSGARNTAEDIINYLDAARPTMLDIDDDGTAQPLSDGIVFIRHLAGFVETALVHDAVNPAGNRTDPQQISDFLDSYTTSSPALSVTRSSSRVTPAERQIEHAELTFQMPTAGTDPALFALTDEPNVSEKIGVDATHAQTDGKPRAGLSAEPSRNSYCLICDYFNLAPDLEAPARGMLSAGLDRVFAEAINPSSGLTLF